MKLKIEKLVHGGQGLAHTETGQTAFVWNALPGEEVEAEILHKKHGIIEAVAREVITASSHRQTPLESFFLSTAPWQIMDYAYENQMKVEIAKETYQHMGGLNIDQLELASLPQTTQYRNKMEYSFYFDETDLWHIAFFLRGSHRKQPTGVSVLATPAINAVAEKVIELIRDAKIPVKTLKSMILRSNQAGDVLYALFVKDESVISALPLAQLAAINSVIGFKVHYSRPTSPASTTDKLLFESGHNEISTQVAGTSLRYGVMSFFQVHEPIFELALQEIGHNIGQGSHIIDYFSGVGAISIPLAAKVATATLIESNAEAVDYAKLNIQHNHLQDRYTAICTPAEKANEYITQDKTIIFDPPRAGLHSDTIAKVLAIKPHKIIYMSCNLATHARDLKLLSESYKIDSLKIFNFFPQTPHIEGLAVLTLR